MKKANNSEMDLILRGLAKNRRDDSSLEVGSSFGDNNGEVGKHLDADELNSFAEGLVPATARVRYMEHLAECSNCRRIVVSLTQAAGFIPSPVAEKQSGPGFWQRMAGVFSPSVLRYAVPALALTAVIAISLLAFRQQRSQEFVAQQQPHEAPATSVSQPVTPEQPVRSTGSETSLPPQTKVNSKPSTNSPQERNDTQSGQGELAKSPAIPGLVSPAQTMNDAASPPPPALSEAARSQPVFAPEPKAGALSSVRTAPGDVSKKAETSKDEQPADRVAQQRQRDFYKLEPSKEAEEKRTGSDATAASGPRRSEAPMTERRAALKSKKDSDDDETRSVSGKRFRRQGDVWVDYSYEPSRATINVTRGSEQFRALVADEPGIRTIANQLGGEVIVVWKGKAYRIR